MGLSKIMQGFDRKIQIPHVFATPAKGFTLGIL